MSASALLDTSFIITLVDASRPRHEVAKQFYRHMLQKGVPMYFSAIVASEFGIKQAITELPLNNFRSLPFNVSHAQKAADLWNALGKRDEGDSRAVVRDDVKLLAQTSREGIAFILTEDESTLCKYCERLREAGQIPTRALKLSDGFDADAFNEDGQRGLSFEDAANDMGN